MRKGKNRRKERKKVKEGKYIKEKRKVNKGRQKRYIEKRERKGNPTRKEIRQEKI